MHIHARSKVAWSNILRDLAAMERCRPKRRFRAPLQLRGSFERPFRAPLQFSGGWSGHFQHPVCSRAGSSSWVERPFLAPIRFLGRFELPLRAPLRPAIWGNPFLELVEFLEPRTQGRQRKSKKHETAT